MWLIEYRAVRLGGVQICDMDNAEGRLNAELLIESVRPQRFLHDSTVVCCCLRHHRCPLFAHCSVAPVGRPFFSFFFLRGGPFDGCVSEPVSSPRDRRRGQRVRAIGIGAPWQEEESSAKNTSCLLRLSSDQVRFWRFDVAESKHLSCLCFDGLAAVERHSRILYAQAVDTVCTS